MSTPIPKKLTMPEAAKLVQTITGESVSRQTVYNWMNQGRGGVKLRSVKTVKGRRTTERWVRDFLTNTAR